MRLLLLVFPLIFLQIPQLANSAVPKIRCTCSTSAGGITCHNGWCEVRSNATHIAACAVVRSEKSGVRKQVLACARVTERADTGYCGYDWNRDATKCWCTKGDYCNVDLVDRIRDKRLSGENDDDYDNSEEFEETVVRNKGKKVDEEDEDEDEEPDFTVETNTEFNENNNEIDEKMSQEEMVDQTVESKNPAVIGAVDMRKPVETRQMSAEEAALPPWRRLNPINAGTEWRPPPPPPMPGKQQLPVVRPAIPTTITTTTTTTTTAPPTTTTTKSYEERMREYEERRRQAEALRESEIRRRQELERQKMEQRRQLESQYEQKRRFGEETRMRVVQEPVTTKTTTQTPPTTTTVTTTTRAPPTTTTTTTPSIIYPPAGFRTAAAPVKEVVTTTTTTAPPPPPVTEKKSLDSYYRNWKPQHRRPLDLNPTQIAVTNFSAIVYPPRGFVKASTTTTSSSTTTTTTTTTMKPTTSATTPPIIYPPAEFKKATKGTATTTTTEFPSTSEIAYNLPNGDDEDGDVELSNDHVDEKEQKVVDMTMRKMVEMPKLESDESEDVVVMYTPKPATSPPLSPEPSQSVVTPSVRTPVEKMNEYKKILGENEPSASSSSFSSIILSSFISIIIFFLF